MECDNWKNLVYNWIKLTKFVTITTDSIEHTNIDKFFENFRQKLTTTKLKETTVSEFLHAHYNSFEYHLDDSKEISSLDYVYIYSLLLHFSCVKYPDPHFHSLCQSLDDSSQISIAKFFNLLLDNDKFDRDTIRAAISAAKPTSRQLLSIDSPIKTPQYMLSPVTPKTNYCEDKNRELIFLKAQLDSERYERSVIEMMLKQTEQKVEKMVQCQRKYLEEIQSLKNELLSCDTENRSPNKNYFPDQKNHRLQKDLLDKEERIIQLQLKIDNLMDDKKVAGEKLALSEKQVSHLISKTHDLEQTIFNIRAELDDRSEKIKYLQETNSDLLNFIRESRGGVYGLDSLNTSSTEGLDFSFARIPNSSDVSTSSPENLGRAVVDIQLKEKETENNLLRDKLDLLKDDLNRITSENSQSQAQMNDEIACLKAANIVVTKEKSELIEKLTNLEAQIQAVNQTNESILKSNSEYIETNSKLQEEGRNLSAQLERADIEIENLVTQLKELDQIVGDISQKSAGLASDNAELSEKLLKFQIDYADSEARIVNLEREILALKQSNESAIKSNSEYVETILKLQKERLNLNANLEQANAEIDRSDTRISELSQLANENCQIQSQMIDEIAKLKRNNDVVLQEKVELAAKLEAEVENLCQVNESVVKSNSEYTQTISKLEEENEHLNIKLGNSKVEIETSQNRIHQLNLTVEESSVELSILKNVNDTVEKEKSELTEQLNKIQVERSNFETRISELQFKVQSLNKNYESAMQSVTEYVETISKLQEEKYNLSSKIEQANAEIASAADKIHKLNQIVDEISMENAVLKKQQIDLTDKLGQFEAECTSSENQIAKLITEIQSLVQNYDFIVKTNSENVEVISKLQEEIRNLSDSRDKATEQNESSATQIRALNQVIKDNSVEVLNLKAANELFTIEKAELIDQITKFQTDCANLQLELEVVKQVNESTAKSNSEYNSIILKLQEEMRIVSAKLDEENAELISSENRISELNEIIEKTSVDMSILKNTNDTIIQEKDELTEKLTKLDADCLNYETRISELHLEIQSMMQSNDTTVKSINNYIETISKLQDEKQNLSIQANAEIESSSAKILELNQIIDETSLKITELVNEKIELSGKLAQYQTECASSESKIAVLSTQNESLSQNYESALKSNSVNVEMISRLQEDIRNLSDYRDKAASEITSSKSQIRELNQVIMNTSVDILSLRTTNDLITKEKANLMEQVSEFQVDCSNLQLQLEVAKQINESSTISNSEYAQSISKLEEECRILRDQLDHVNEERDSSLNRISQITKILNEKSTKIFGLANEKTELIEKVDKLGNNCTNYETRIAELSTDIEAARQINETTAKSNSEYVETISKLEEECNHLKEQLDKSNAESVTSTDRLEKINEAVIKEKVELNDKLVQAQTDFNTLENGIVELTAEISKTCARNEIIPTLEMQISDLLVEKDKLTKKLRDSALTVETLSQANDVAAKSNSEFLETIAKLEMSSKTLVSKLESANDTNSQLSKAVDKSKIQINELNESRIAESAKYEMLLSELRKEKDDLIQSVGNLKNESSQLKMQLESSDIEFQKISNRYSELNVKLEQMAKEKSEIQLQLTKETNTSIDAISKISFENSKLNEQVQALQTEVEQLTQSHESEMKELSTNNSKLAMEINELRTNGEQSRDVNHRLTEDISTLESKITDLLSENQSRLDELAKYEIKISEICREKEDLIHTISNLKDESSQLRTQLVNCELQINKMSVVNSELNEKLEEMVKNKSEIQTQMTQEADAYNDKISTIITENTELSELVEDLQTEKNRKIGEFSIQISELSTKVSELEKFQDSNLRLTEEISSLESTIKDLSAENQSRISELAKYENTISELRKEKEDFIQTVTNLKDESSELSTRLVNRDIQIKETSAINSELSVKLEEMTKEKSKIQIQFTQEVDEFTIKISKITAENVKLSEQVESLQTEVKQLTEANESQIKELSLKNSELSTEITELRTNAEQSRDANLRLTEEIFTSESKIKDLHAENQSLGDKIAALNSEILVEKDRMFKKVEQLNCEIDNLVQNYESIQKDKTDLEVDLKIVRSELSNLKESHSDAHSIKLTLIEKEQMINSLEYNINKLQKDKLEKDKYIENLDERISQKEMEIASLMQKLQDSCEKDKLLNREKELNEKFTQDIAILKAKLYKHREMSEEHAKNWKAEKELLMSNIDELKSADDRIDEHRRELVGKLEKMKAKMKALYNEEMIKLKTRHEYEISDIQKQAKEKFAKYDSHIEKLSKQIYQLNEKNLGLEKDNKFLRTKIDFLEINTDAAGSTMALNSIGSGGSRNLIQSTNLKMEDEEGEVFNNTYLTDLKTGERLSPTNMGLGRDSVKFTELQHRNSLMPRHLRSTYAAQYGDQDLREEDLKDPVNLDDSLCSLLYGQRKKISGATTYKRPGPPTPSKKAGRLSFGGVTELQTREILKENTNIPTRLSVTGTSGFGMGGGNKRNTPGKLKSLFSSSTSKIKDDFHPDLLDKSLLARKSQLEQLIITSTPRRRSQINRCRPRLSGHFGISKATPKKFNSRHLKVASCIQSAGSVSSTQKFSIYEQKQHGEWRQAGTIIDSESCTSTSQTGSDCEESSYREQNTTLKSTSNTTGRRRSNKFTVKTSALSHTRNRYRMKSKENRLENFNRARRSINNFILRKSLLSRISTMEDNDHNDLESNPYELLKDLVALSSQAVAATKFNDGEAPSFAEFEKLAKFKVSEAPFEITTPETPLIDSQPVIKTSSLKKKTLYSGGVIINRKIPRLSIRIGGYHILNRGYSNDSSNRSYDHSLSVTRNWSHACYVWRQCDRRVKQFGIGLVLLLVILNIICAVKFLYF